MSFSATLYFLVKCMVLPPGLTVAVGLAGALLYPRWRRLGVALLIAAPLLSWVLCMPLFAALAARPFETFPALDLATLVSRPADALVVLGGGAYAHAPEYQNGGNVRPMTLERLRYGAHLQRLTHLPVVVSGGQPRFMAETEAALMKRALEEDFGVPVAAVEDRSRNTRENATMSRAALPYQTIVLVTHAMHMQRAKAQFEQAGFSVIPAPMGFISDHTFDYALADFLPTLQGLSDSWYVVYEAAGALWYRYAYD